MLTVAEKAEQGLAFVGASNQTRGVGVVVGHSPVHVAVAVAVAVTVGVDDDDGVGVALFVGVGDDDGVAVGHMPVHVAVAVAVAVDVGVVVGGGLAEQKGSAVMPAVGVGSASTGDRTDRVNIKRSARNPRETIPDTNRIMAPPSHSHA